MLSLAIVTASSSSWNVSTVSTGPKDSFCVTDIALLHRSRTVGR